MFQSRKVEFDGGSKAHASSFNMQFLGAPPTYCGAPVHSMKQQLELLKLANLQKRSSSRLRALLCALPLLPQSDTPGTATSLILSTHSHRLLLITSWVMCCLTLLSCLELIWSRLKAQSPHSLAALTAGDLDLPASLLSQPGTRFIHHALLSTQTLVFIKSAVTLYICLYTCMLSTVNTICLSVPQHPFILKMILIVSEIKVSSSTLFCSLCFAMYPWMYGELSLDYFDSEKNSNT